MLKVIIAIVVVVLLTIGIVYVIDKFVPKKLKPVINLLLWALIIYLGYATFMSVYGEIQFNKLKNKRYAVVIERLKDVRDAELAYKDLYGKYTGNFDSLIKFIGEAQIPILQRRDSTVLDVEATQRFGGVETFKSIVLIDTLSYYSVKDSLFGGKDTYKNIADVGIGQPGAKFKLQAGSLDDIPVFEASVDKSVILYDQEKNLVAQEKQVVSVDGVNGPTLKVGSMDQINTNGNWPQNFSKEQ